jgi:hypothetical protein
MKKRLGILAATLLATVTCPLPAQKEAAKTPHASPGKTTGLAEEEKEILKNRELLENLELLQNLEAIKYLHFLTEAKAGDKGVQPPSKVTGKDDAKKTKKQP